MSYAEGTSLETYHEVYSESHFPTEAVISDRRGGCVQVVSAVSVCRILGVRIGLR